MPDVTEHQDDPIPDDPDELADFIIEGRRTYLRGQRTLRDTSGDEKTLRDRGDTQGAADMTARRARFEATLDDIADQVRLASRELIARGTQAACEGTFTEREARQVLVALGGGEQPLTALRERPEYMTELLRAVATNPLPLPIKQLMIDGIEAEGAPRELGTVIGLLADAIHQAVFRVYGPEATMPVPYALAGAQVLTHYGIPVIPRAGHILAVAEAGTQPIGYWVWMTSDPAAEVVAGIEIADFALHHLPTALAEAGITWDREPPPAWYCGPVSKLADIGIAYQAADFSPEEIEQLGGAETAKTVSTALDILGTGKPEG
jgi:hypothetical protein